jgi:2-furoate---CoA ligase
VREIPKSPVGKVLRRKLVAGEYEADAASAASPSSSSTEELTR